MTLRMRGLCLLSLLIVSFCGQVYCARNEGRCTTADGDRGSCITLPDCSYAMNIIRKTGITSRESQNFLNSNQCGYEGRVPNVCCPQDENNSFEQEGNQNQGSNSREDGDSDQTITNPLSLLPNECGVYISNRIIGGDATELAEFPWMALLEYVEVGKGLTTACGGALITNRYVLTAAHCIRAAPSYLHLSSVRLGEYDLRSDPDCIDNGDGDESCADPKISVPIERTIVHESYMSPNRHSNDIALLRLAYDVPTTAFIQPICLPVSNEIGRLYWSAGWGATETKRSSNVKLKVSLPYYDFNQCAATYRTRNVILGKGQMCAGGRAGKDTCKGDSSGPLMRQKQQTSGPNRWFVEGVVSIGHTPCGLPGWPAVYTKVHDYIPWIVKQLRP